MVLESWREQEDGLPPESRGPRINAAPAAIAEREREAEKAKEKSYFARFTETLDDIRESAVRHMNRENIEKLLKEKKIFGKSAWAISMILVGSGGASAARWGTRYAAWFLNFGSFGTSVAGGAFAGLVVEGVRTYIKERGRDVSTEEIRERAEKITKEELRRKIDVYLAVADKETIDPDETSQKNELYRGAKRALGVRKMEVAKGAAKGAAMGAIGGIIGWKAAEWLSGLAEAKMATKEAAKAAADAAQEQIGRATEEASRSAFEKAIELGIAGMDNQTFQTKALPGKGFTNVARVLIHDYISQQNELGKFLNQKVALEKAQLIYAEDYLRRMLGGDRVVALGESFKISGKLIKEAIAEAQGLGAEEIKNLNKNWVTQVGQKAWEEATSPEILNPQNNFSREIIEGARRRSFVAARAAATEAAHAAAKKVSATAERAKDSWFSYKIALGALGGTVGLAANVLIYRHRESLKRMAGRMMETGKSTAGSLRETGKNAGARALQWMPRRMPQMPSFNILPKGFSLSEKFPGLAARLRRKERPADEPVAETRESLLRRAGRRIANTAKGARETILNRITEKDQARFEKDPLARTLKEGSITVKPGDICYSAPRPKDLKKEDREPKILIFTDYSSYRKHWDKLTKEEQLLSLESGECGVSFSDDITKTVKSEDELGKRLQEFVKKALLGLLADEYAGLPERADELTRYLQEREEELRKREEDPLNQLLDTEGVRPTAGEHFWYRAPDIKHIDPDTGATKILEFRNYSDFRAYLDSLSPKERQAAKEFTQDVDGESDCILGIWTSRKLEKVLKKNPVFAEKWHTLTDKAWEGRLADAYRGVPEREAVTRDRVEEFAKEVVGEEPRFYANLYSHEDEYEGLKKLRDNPELVRLLQESGIKFFAFGARNELQYAHGYVMQLLLDPNSQVDEIHDFLVQVASEIEPFSRKVLEVEEKRDAVNAIFDAHGLTTRFDIETLLSVGLEDQSRMLDTLKEVFIGDFPFEILRAVDSLELGTGRAKERGSHVRLFIPHDLSSREMREFILREAEKAKTIKEQAAS